jgi:prophage antirepressor-like protein
MDAVFTPTHFLRHNRPLRAVLIDDQPWFVARDLALLIGHKLEDRIVHRLDVDQTRTVALVYAASEPQPTLMISESGLYAALIYYRHPENRSLRRWITGEVVPALRGEPEKPEPRRSLLRWERQEVALLHWQDCLWVRFSDMPFLLESGYPRAKMRRPRLLGLWARRS